MITRYHLEFIHCQRSHGHHRGKMEFSRCWRCVLYVLMVTLNVTGPITKHKNINAIINHYMQKYHIPVNLNWRWYRMENRRSKRAGTGKESK